MKKFLVWFAAFCAVWVWTGCSDQMVDPAAVPTSASASGKEPGGSFLKTLPQSTQDLILLPLLPGWPSDPITIRQVSIVGNKMTVAVVYTGGCRIHTFRLVSTYPTIEKQPRVLMRLYHEGNDDPCNLQISEDLVFDLSPLKNYQLGDLTVNCGRIDLELMNPPMDNLNLKYRFCRRNDIIVVKSPR